MTQAISRFLRDEDGAVTIDWVVLTAAIVGLGFAVINGISAGTNNIGNSTGTALTSLQVSLEPPTPTP